MRRHGSRDPYWHEQKLVRLECVPCPWALQQNKVSTIFGIIGPRGVRAWNEVSTIFGIIFLFSTTCFSPRRGCLRFMKSCTEF
jgi:hypothetical protein